MPLGATREAIGAVSEALRAQLASRTSLLVTVSRPDVAATSDDEPKLNLFLYQADFDPFLKSIPIDEGQPAPLWLVLRYLLTAYDLGHDSDSIDAHRLLARGLSGLQQMTFMEPTAAALVDNPEPLKLTFDACDVELLSKVMQGTDEKYRLSAAFQVRPVLIAPDTPPAYAPPVLTVGPPGAEGVVVLPSMGPRLREIVPARFGAGAELRLVGNDIGSAIEIAYVGDLALPVIAARDGEVRVRLPADPPLPAGDVPIRVARRLPSGRELSSNPLFAQLVPTVSTATPAGLLAAGTNVRGSLTITGTRLGGPDDLVFVAFHRNGTVALNLEVPGSPAQTGLLATVDAAHAVPPGDYRIIVRVNGAQAFAAPEVAWRL
jgi:hypothetical protein